VQESRRTSLEPAPGAAASGWRWGDERLSSALDCLYLPPGVETAGHVLARIGYGATPTRTVSGVGLTVPLPQLGEMPCEEVWRVPELPRRWRQGDLELAAAGDVLFGACVLPAGNGKEVEEATGRAYRSCLTSAVASGFPHLLRFWNVVPGINLEDRGLERYQRFCRARAEAFEARFGPDFWRNLCAASAVGSSSEDLVVYFLAARSAGDHRENPRQVSAYRYPRRYGPRSPSFSRATRGPRCLGSPLFLSGTAAIVGHASVHRDLLVEQVRETVENLDVLLAGEGRGLVLRQLKAYVRDPAHVAAVRGELAHLLPPDVAVLFLQADICRHELLVEIEGIAG
jgi:chorismate lyase/3-hydroxybenzoate synthase